jgi:glycogen synthase
MYRRYTYLCICEGQQEEMYLNHVASLLKRFPERVVTFNMMYGSVEKLKKNYTEYDNAVLFDHDFMDNEFQQKIKFCEQLHKNRKQKGQNVYHAYSNLNIDLWFILHKENFNRPVYSNDAYVDDVRRIYGLNREADIKEKGNLERILRQITIEDVKSAIRRAEQIRKAKLQSDHFMVGTVICYSNPDFSLHKFLRIVLENCGEV